VLIAVPPIETWVDKQKKEYRLSIAVPGMDQKDLQVSLQGNNLSVSGERKDNEQNKDAYYFAAGIFSKTSSPHTTMACWNQSTASRVSSAQTN
jgi:HSP20 family molecular chaperone IbpA